jgi:broad specificity phosphatase PhoE
MIERLLIARHAESECSRASMLNGDPTRPCPLSEQGRAQAREMGERLATTPIDVCFVTQFERTHETAHLALTGRDVRIVEERLLNDPFLGEFEGTEYDAHDRWMDAHDWHAKPPGGENQLEALTRYVAGFRRVLVADARTALVVAHHFPISFVLTIAWDDGPTIRRRYSRKIAPAEINELDPVSLSDELDKAAAELVALGIEVPA